MGSSPLSELRARAHRRALDYRSIDRTVYSHDFERVWKSDPDKGGELVEKGDRLGLHRLMVIKIWNMQDLRTKCMRWGIKNYSRMKREELEQNVYAIQRDLYGDESGDSDQGKS